MTQCVLSYFHTVIFSIKGKNYNQRMESVNFDFIPGVGKIIHNNRGSIHWFPQHGMSFFRVIGGTSESKNFMLERLFQWVLWYLLKLGYYHQV